MKSVPIPQKVTTDVPAIRDRKVTGVVVNDLKVVVLRLAQRAVSLAGSLAANRQHRPWLSLVAVPLALTAVTLLYLFWLVIPLGILSWWWAPEEWPWAWLLGVMEACFTVLWASFGIAVLTFFPHALWQVGLGWVVSAGFVAGTSALNRQRFQRKYGW